MRTKPFKKQFIFHAHATLKENKVFYINFHAGNISRMHKEGLIVNKKLYIHLKLTH